MSTAGLLVLCADVGSVNTGKFGWASDVPGGVPADHHASIERFARAATDHVQAGGKVALGFESPLAVPVPADWKRLGKARDGEGSRPWSANAGAQVLATGIAQVAWVLRRVKEDCPDAAYFTGWKQFDRAPAGLLVWEAFVSGAAKADSHHGDAEIAVAAFVAGLPDPSAGQTVSAQSPLSLASAAALWAGWTNDVNALAMAPLVVRP